MTGLTHLPAVGEISFTPTAPLPPTQTLPQVMNFPVEKAGKALGPHLFLSAHTFTVPAPALESAAVRLPPCILLKKICALSKLFQLEAINEMFVICLFYTYMGDLHLPFFRIIL